MGRAETGSEITCSGTIEYEYVRKFHFQQNVKSNKETQKIIFWWDKIKTLEMK